MSDAIVRDDESFVHRIKVTLVLGTLKFAVLHFDDSTFQLIPIYFYFILTSV